MNEVGEQFLEHDHNGEPVVVMIAKCPVCKNTHKLWVPENAVRFMQELYNGAKK